MMAESVTREKKKPKKSAGTKRIGGFSEHLLKMIRAKEELLKDRKKKRELAAPGIEAEKNQQ